MNDIHTPAQATQTETAFWNLSVTEAEARLQTNASAGLDSTEAALRLERHGRNELTGQKKRSLLARFAGQFKSFMILVLLAAAVISGVTGYLEGEGFTDAFIILAIVIVNAVIGTAQEAKAENALAALEKMSAPHCTVLRDGQAAVIEARDLVPGDVVLLEAGNLVPADMRLAEAVNLKVQEAALTGESLPEEKHTDALDGNILLGDRENMAFASSIVTYGRCKGLVTSTGMGTEVGKIAGMLQSVPESKSPLQARIDQLGRYLGIASITVCAVIFIAGMLQGRDLLGMFMVAVSLAVAAIPEGLPAVATVVLAVGMQRLASKHAIVKNLPSVETLGSTTVICSDKTGTLTQNRMTVMRLFADGETAAASEVTAGGTGDTRNRLLFAGILANDGLLSTTESGPETTGDPTETALIDFGVRLGLDKNELERTYRRVAEIPFDSERKMMSTVNAAPSGALTAYVKGGPDEVLERCSRILRNGSPVPLDERARQEIRDANRAMAEQALRVLAGAYRPLEELPASMDSATLEKDMIFCGLFGMMDPPREEVKAAVATCRRAGIRPVMITGDHLLTATAIAGELGIRQSGDTSFTGADLEAMSDEALAGHVAGTSVFARVAPEHKVRIVRALQSRNEVVAMTGDGVNDAPALKLADIGVAMGITGTDVSKEAADIVLTDDNFATIVAAVEEGRRIYDNILKAIQFLLSTNVGEILVLFIAILAGWATPLLPVQILWINLVSDSLPALALSVDPADKGIMDRKPVDAAQSILHGRFLARILLQGMMIAALSLTAFRIGLHASEEAARTMTFAVLAFCQIAHAFNVRSATNSAFGQLFDNRLLLGALGIVFMLMIVVLELPALHDVFHIVPLTTTQWLWVAGLSVAPLGLVEIVKAFMRRRIV